jgi:diphthamide biosynthesis methyltransferase
LKENQERDAHTLLLLDLRPSENRFMSVGDAIRFLLRTEMKRNEKVFSERTFVVGCARIGAGDQKIAAGSAGRIMKLDFGEPVHCLVVPGKLHFVEEEFLGQFRI